LDIDNSTLRDRITAAVSDALKPLPFVLAGWESGSVAFDTVDEYSDIDLNFLLDDSTPADQFYTVVESALETVSPIMAIHSEPPGRYFKLFDGGEFLLVDICNYDTGNFRECLDISRHGIIRPLFDKGQWLSVAGSAETTHCAHRDKRLQELKTWFTISQNFVHKSINRGQKAEAFAAFWGYTLKPLVELLRMRYCPARWDFGMRYLQRDLPGPVYDELQNTMFVHTPNDIAEHLAQAIAWGERLLRELDPVGVDESSPNAG